MLRLRHSLQLGAIAIHVCAMTQTTACCTGVGELMCHDPAIYLLPKPSRLFPPRTHHRLDTEAAK